MGKEAEQAEEPQWGSQAKGLQGQRALSATPAQKARRYQGCKPEGTGVKGIIVLPSDSTSQAVPRSLQKPTHSVTCCSSLTLSGLSFGNSSSGLSILHAGAVRTRVLGVCCSTQDAPTIPLPYCAILTPMPATPRRIGTPAKIAINPVANNNTLSYQFAAEMLCNCRT